MNFENVIDNTDGNVDLDPDIILELNPIPKILLDDMQQDEFEEDVAEAMFHLAQQLADKEGREEARRIGGPSIVLIAMRKFPSNGDVQRIGCGILAVLVSHGTILIEPQRELLFSIGAVESIVKAMRRFLMEEKMVLNGLVALHNLFNRVEKASDAVKRRTDKFIQEWGGVKLIVDAMTKYPDNSRCQEYCCGILLQLTYKMENLKTMTKTGTISAVSAASNRHPENPRVQAASKKFVQAMFA